MTWNDDDLIGRGTLDVAEAAPRRTAVAWKRLESDLDRHRLGMAACARRGEADLTRGAQLVACVAALRLATAPTASARHHGRRADSLRGFVDELPPDARPRMSALIDAGLAQDGAACHLDLAADRVEVGATVGPVARGRGRASRGAVGDGWRFDLDRRDLDRYVSAAATGADIDAILAQSVDLVRGMIGATRPVGACSRLADLAYALSATAMRTRDNSESSVRTLDILLRTLRRWPRPAPVIRAAIALERERWGGEAAGSA